MPAPLPVTFERFPQSLDTYCSPHLPRSHFQGATPENGYQLPPPPYVCRFSYNPYSGEADGDGFKAFVV
jgi:hypothetical protein